MAIHKHGVKRPVGKGVKGGSRSPRSPRSTAPKTVIRTSSVRRKV